MEKTQLKKHIKQLFPVFNQTEMVNELVEKGVFLELPSDYPVLDAGSIIKIVPLVFSGSIKVMREDDDGNEMFLYYIRAGQSCAMTLSSCLKREKSTIKATVQTKTKALAIPSEVIYAFIHKYPSWIDFMVETYSYRFEEIIEVIDNIAFHNMDVRLIKYLMDKCSLLNTKILNISHTEIAKDLNSSREVISRLLKQLERKRVVKLSRGKIVVLDLFSL